MALPILDALGKVLDRLFVLGRSLGLVDARRDALLRVNSRAEFVIVRVVLA